jgi:hypothetical protein
MYNVVLKRKTNKQKKMCGRVSANEDDGRKKCGEPPIKCIVLLG